ncbi:MAG: ribonuclease H-like domain-containing protein [Limnochordia bacterium]
MLLKDKLRLMTSRPKPKELPPVDLSPVLGGSRLTNAFGSCHRISTYYRLDYTHGADQLGSLLTADHRGITHLLQLEDLHGLDPRRLVFLDTETTGLAGGTGTYAFLVGLGWLEKDRFVVEQYLMGDYHEEGALLAAIEERLIGAQGIVTFNGKCFDWPLLQGRFILNGFTPPGEGLHFDLLYPARRLWGARLTSCSLNSLERNLLAVFRVDDLPGSEVPQRYFDFLRTRQAHLLRAIVDHNRLDILSLVGLWNLLAAKGMLSPEECLCASEAEGLARLSVQKKDWLQAARFYERSCQLAPNAHWRRKAASQLAECYRKGGRWPLAERLWLQLLDEGEDIVACEQLAKYYEHRKRDLAAAQQMAKRGLALALRCHPRRVGAFEHRLSRIEAKRGRRGQRSTG